MDQSSIAKGQLARARARSACRWQPVLATGVARLGHLGDL